MLGKAGVDLLTILSRGAGIWKIVGRRIGRAEAIHPLTAQVSRMSLIAAAHSPRNQGGPQMIADLRRWFDYHFLYLRVSAKSAGHSCPQLTLRPR